MPGTSQKDNWDRITAMATILVPAAIALAGHFVAQGLKQAEINSEEKRAERTSAIADANTKIAQANLINTMMKSLTSPNPAERKLAVQAVLIALPDQGPVLVRTVAESDENKAVQIAAQASLDQRINLLIRNLFSDDAHTRINSASDLVEGWRNDPAAIPPLIQFATKNSDNQNGVYNTIVVLNDFSLPALQAHRQLILQFIALAKTKGEKTAAKAAELGKKI
ncbi:hypothetical protein [Geomonas ferrireducens]|uniref:hypothetical protein n=1 Tax=Geomonas ferrireducens TaxID=2570227 RepID=UPI0010A81A4C|nr:hypothetical protein [Geomonas ferrireducens]